jgi:alpha-tubulin suppressor-like RCC1 family protein
VSCSGGIQKEDPSTAANPVPGVFTDIAIGYGFGCGLQSNGRVACWNWGPTAADNPVVAPTGTFTAISVGCGVLSDGTASCWGSKNSGQMSPPAGSFQSVSSSCGVRTDGEIMCWDSATGAARTPTFAPVPRGPFTQISVGSGHACALRPSGAIVCFGSNSYGQATIPGM